MDHDPVFIIGVGFYRCAGPSTENFVMFIGSAPVVCVHGVHIPAFAVVVIDGDEVFLVRAHPSFRLVAGAVGFIRSHGEVAVAIFYEHGGFGFILISIVESDFVIVLTEIHGNVNHVPIGFIDLKCFNVG